LEYMFIYLNVPLNHITKEKTFEEVLIKEKKEGMIR
jgi:hypothetical protein